MVHIVKSKKTGQFMVIVTGRNGEKLSTSELLNTKQSAFKNVRAQLVQMESDNCCVQDNSKNGNPIVRVYTYTHKNEPTCFSSEQEPRP